MDELIVPFIDFETGLSDAMGIDVLQQMQKICTLLQRTFLWFNHQLFLLVEVGLEQALLQRTLLQFNHQQLFLLVEVGLEQAVRWTEVFYQHKVESLALLTDLEVKVLFKNASFTSLPLVPGLTLANVCSKINVFKNIGKISKITTHLSFHLFHALSITLFFI